MKKLALGLVVLTLITLISCGGGGIATTNSPSPSTRSVNASITVKNSVNGAFDLALSTSFQPAEWDNAFFSTNQSAKTALLGNLHPNHIRLQGLSQGVPQTSPSTWNFTVLDDVTQPVLGVGDRSPEFQVAKAPAFMYVNGDSSKSFIDTSFQSFAAYAQNLVRYYNVPGGFNAADGQHASPSGVPIQWWGIYNEPSINNNVDAATYVNMYNTLVPAMKAVDPTLKFVAIELCCSSESSYVPAFVSGVSANAPVDAIAAHYYSSCNQKDSDLQLFSTVPGFAASVRSIYGFLSVNPALANVPVWVTENNVNADFNIGNGTSACNPGQVFVTDQRGTSAFFAAWRPYVFSQLGKAGAHALYHWDFDADAQYGEVDYNSGNPQLSYWVDYWLSQLFPAGAGQQLLNFTNSDSVDIEVLPVLNSNGSITVLISNHAVATSTDNNGTGLAANISVDLSAFTPLHSASLMIIDSKTSAASGPTASAIPATSPMTVTLNGYGVAFLNLR